MARADDRRPFFEAIRDHSFSAAHQLRGYQGKCERLHGHNWRVRVAVRSGKLDDAGMVIDFHDLDDIIRKAVAGLEDTLLNEVAPFDERNPSAEEIARHVAGEVGKSLARKDIRVDRVEVWENDRSCAVYYA